MKIIRSLLGYLTPDICLGCDKEGEVLCPDCEETLNYPPRCIGCKKPVNGGLTCPKCSKSSHVSTLIVVAEYSGLGKDLVMRLKYKPSIMSSRSLGRAMSAVLPYLEKDEAVLSYIPTTPPRVRERGFDQAKELAKRVGSIRKIRYTSSLRRITKSHQVGSTKSERYAHMKGAFIAKNSSLFAGKTVVLVDDVLTTGATMESASKVLIQNGARRVVGLVFARAD